MNTTLKRIVISFAVAVLVIGALVGAMFAFGKPMTSQAPPQAAASAEGGGPISAPIGGSDPFAVQIPGCVCHSDDPAVVEAHAAYRMSQCFDCHRDGMPEMGQ